ncbi:MAG TPA: branched-chain amino acid ABC transporter permease/ATP-binding protein [Nocardioides sp.]|nr:branched-chain amino acid ABC transporter permease/ATP-binding protein [Nocardioides sp.]
MSDLLSFALLGLGLGAVYTLLAQGLVVIHRASGVLNFALGAQAMAAAFLWWELNTNQGLPQVPSVLIAVAASALLGVLIHLVVMVPLARSAPLVRITAALSILLILQTVAGMRYGKEVLFPLPFLPHDVVEVAGTTLTEDRLWLAGIAVALTVVLAVGYRLLLIGRATEAVAANARLAASLGWSPITVGAVNWAVGSGMAGLAGVLITGGGMNIIPLEPTRLTLLIIPALAVAMLAGFRSFWLTCLAGFAVGIAQSELFGFYGDIQGIDKAAPLFVIIAVLCLSGRGIPTRDFTHDKLPAVGPAFPRPASVVIAAVVAIVLVFFVSDSYANAMINTAITAVLLVSVVVVTGFAGQLSLAQYAIAGLGAYTSGRLAATQHWPFEVCFALGVLTAVVVGSLFALPALRARGATLAVMTLGLGQVVSDGFLTNTKYTGELMPTTPGPQTVLGIGIDPVTHPERYAAFCLVVLVVCLLVAGSVRRSRAGRRLLAVRENERAASALGVNVVSAKLYAFAVSSGIAGTAGVLAAFQFHTVDYTRFQPFISITFVTFAVLAGIGYLAGQPLIAMFAAVGGVGTVLFADFGWDTAWVTIVGSALTLITLVGAPDGIAANGVDFRKHLRRSAPDVTEEETPVEDRPTPEGLQKAPPMSLEMSGIAVRFGGVHALTEVDFTARPGEIVGLIGPNGAGKTTLIDVASGFVAPASGRVRLGDRDITRSSRHQRARAGLSRSFQSLELFDDLSVRENLLAAADDRDALAWLTSLVHPGSLDLPPAAQAAVDVFDLARVLDNKPTELPYGQRRLVAIARAVASAPSVIMLDEPAAGLSRRQTDELGQLIRIMAREMGMTVVLVEHDLQFVLDVSDRLVVLDRGRHLAEGTPHEVVALPEVRTAYLGAEDDEEPAAEGDVSVPETVGSES